MDGFGAIRQTVRDTAICIIGYFLTPDNLSRMTDFG